jgi:hypothetical protein
LVQELGALEHILAVGGREDEVVLGEVVPHEPVLVAPENVRIFLSGSPKFREIKICQRKEYSLFIQV